MIKHINFGPKINSLLYAEKINGKRVKYGLKRSPFDHRDFNVGIFGWGDYTPKHQFHLIPTQSVKNQGGFNTCGWNSVTVQKEVDEKTRLSVSALVRYARAKFLLSGNGFSNLRNNQQAVKDFGIPEEYFFREDVQNWDEYSDPKKLTADVYANAANHKDQTFWSVTAKNDLLKLLDQDRVLATGLMWYSGFNMGYGFNAPWIISKYLGAVLGGHAFPMKGYVMQYKGIDENKHLICGPGGKDVFAFQQSYGADWGATVIDENGVEHKGIFFIEMDFFMTQGYERYVQLDIPIDVATFVNQWNGFNVKAANSPAIYWIADGKKRAYPSMLAFIAYNGMVGTWETIKDSASIEALKAVPDDIPMKLEDGPLFPIMKTAVQPVNMEAILATFVNKKLGANFDNTSKAWITFGM